MTTMRWGRDQATAVVDPLTVDDLDEVDLLVVDGVGHDDDDRLAWWERAPCVVVGIARDVSSRPTALDVVLGPSDDDVLDRLQHAIEAQPAAARMLAQVLRAMPRLSVVDGLLVESLAYSTLMAGPAHRRWLAQRPTSSRKDFDGPPISVTRSATEVRLTLQRPENRNAFSASMRDALVEALTAAELDPTVAAVLVDAEGPSFSSGGDLHEFGTATDVVRAHEVRSLRSVAAALERLRPRLTVVVHGPCVGAGVELSAFAARLVARPGTTFRLPEVSMGLIPGAGGTVSITRRMGRHTTALFALLGDDIDDQTALRLGLVDEVR